MGLRLNRRDFQKLSILRLKEAKILFKSGSPQGAFYLAGYAIECALKACIAKQTRQSEFPPSRRVIEEYYKHDPTALIGAAQLRPALDAERATNLDFEENWKVVSGWSEQIRYSHSVSEPEARDLIAAISDRRNGVLPWLKRYW